MRLLGYDDWFEQQCSAALGPPPQMLATLFGGRLDARMLVAEPLAGARHAALNFVADQQPALFVTQLAQALLELNGSQVNAALALDDFQHHGDDIVVVLGDVPDRL